MRRLAGGAVVCAVVLALWAAPAWGQSGLPLALPIPNNGPQPQPYGTNDFGGFRNILPPGQNGFDNLTQLGAFEATGARPAHNDDQLGMYANLVYAAPGLTAAQLPDYFKDATFGVKPGDVEAHVEPALGRHDRARQAIRRTPHLRKHARRDDVRRRLRGRRGPALLHRRAASRRPQPAVLVRRRRANNRAWTRSVGPRRPTPRPTSSRQIDQLDELYGADGAQAPAGRHQLRRRDQRIHHRGATRTRRRCRASTPRSGKPLGPMTGRPTDVIAIAALVGGDLRQGRRRRAGLGAGARGGAEAVRRRARQGRSGPTSAGGRPRGAHHRARRQDLPLRGAAAARGRGQLAMPDPGTLQRHPGHATQPLARAPRPRARPRAGCAGCWRSRGGSSNALLRLGAPSRSPATRWPCWARRSATSRRRS